MKKLLFVCVLAGLMTAMTGCGERAASSGRPLAVVNFDDVLRKLGWFDKFTAVLNGDQQAMNNELNHVRDQFKKQIDDTRRKLADDAHMSADKREAFMANLNPAEWVEKYQIPKEKVEELMRMDASYGQQYAGVQARFREVLGNRRDEFVRQFRVLMDPVIDRVARKANVGVVIMMNPGVVYHDSASDITVDVVDDMSKNNPPMPKLPELTVPSLTLPPPATQPAP
jgi:Skp family chaperone for outer membrane proteins